MAGSLILLVPKKLSQRKKKGLDSELKPSDSFDSKFDLKKALARPDSPSSPMKFSFKKVESWSCELPFKGPDTGKTYSRDSSFLKFLPKTKPAPEEPPSDDPKESKQMENDQHDDDEKLRNNQNPVDSSDGANNNNNDNKDGVSFEAISDEEFPDRPIICDSRVQVGDHYYVKRSVASILRSILNKYGDIARDCKLTSVVMRSNYLECLCLVIRELQSSSIEKMSKSKLKEMWAITKDVEAVGIKVGWLQKTLDEIKEAVELVKKSRSAEEEKKKFDSNVESVRKDLEACMQDLAEKEKEVAVARARVEETRGRLSELEKECSRLNETILSIKSKVDGIDCKAKVAEIL
ncbi:hypothetical protein CRG98_027150 [Punica granatum]|uniref:Uncharacterized protein n=1 Tax=Punica granatum TaxID=22663 RepID=A0A2I0J8A8_PUNGR|nr:hypothetical protein CRG98_027150 [Punica granatum]